jgi:coenzyme F420 hydrogenase subunit beta
MSVDPITRMVSRNLCTGCGACAGAFPNLIRMVDDPVAGRRPVVEASAEGHRAASAAQGLCAGAATDWTGLARTDAVDRDWGPVLAAWEGWASDNEIRHRGSSGGPSPRSPPSRSTAARRTASPTSRPATTIPG